MSQNERLKELERLARFPTENPNPVLRVDPDNRIDFANDASGPILANLEASLGERPREECLAALDCARARRSAQSLEIDCDDRSYVLSLTPVADADHVYIYCQDVTDQRSAEAQLHVMAKFPTENPNPVMRVSPQGDIEFANHAAESLLKALGGETERVPEAWVHDFREAHDDSRAREVHVAVVDQDYALAVTPVEGAPYLYVYGKNVTEKKKAEEDLIEAKEAAEAASRTKSTFLANMSHELRTPLNAIIGYGELLEEEIQELEHEHLLPDLIKIQAAGKHLLGLINQVLDLSKVEAGKMDLHWESIEVERLLHEVASTVKPLVVKNDNELHVELNPNLGSCLADITKLRQILFNLLSNAAKFTSKGVITLKAKRKETDEGALIRFEVRDSGIGMTQEQVDRVFEPFTQADASTTREFGGTGLGLAITKKFVEMMGGRIKLRSIPNEGTRFSVLLPATRDESAPSRLSSSEFAALRLTDEFIPVIRHRRGPSNGLTVLVIDDDATVRDLLRRVLEAEGFRVETATNGLAGLDRAREVVPDAITLDVMMPGIDGWRVLSELKADASLATIPVIMVTIVEERGAGFALGAADYLTKPFDRAQLIKALERHTQRDGSTVLIVDDDTANRELLRRIVEPRGVNVVEAKDGKEALDILEKETPSLIFLDLMMPRMNGFEVLERLSTDTRWAKIPVVVVTAKELDSDERARLERSVAATIQKQGIPMAELSNLVHELLKDEPEPSGESQAALPTS